MNLIKRLASKLLSLAKAARVIPLKRVLTSSKGRMLPSEPYNLEAKALPAMMPT